LESIDCGQDFKVLVDYAHTDDALANVLGMLRKLCKGELRVVFGCGGDRDRSKRSRMARVAQEFADKVFVTSDNPRCESPERIFYDIMQGFDEAGAGVVTVEADRKKAIELAVEGCGKDDIVLIAGKGHETYQVIGREKHDFDDREIVRELLNR
jgi:UDP-N-acetylmuramoyl-L-alanyl-D-glutamate--2,6-diaminopimelate ligase